MNDLQRLLDMAVRWDGATTLKARDIIDGRLRELDEPLNKRLVSVCCEAEPTDEITDGTGRCSRCKENAMFESDTWTQPMTVDEYRAQTEQPWREPSAQLQRRDGLEPCKRCGLFRVDHETPGGIPFHTFVSEGAELQAGLEEALKRDQDSTD